MDNRFGWLNLLTIADEGFHNQAREAGMVTQRTERAKAIAESGTDQTEQRGLYQLCYELVGHKALRDRTSVDV